MKTLCTLVWIVLLNSNAFAENFFQKVEINIDVWSVTFRDKEDPYGGRYNLTIDDMDRGLTGFRQVLTLKKGEVLHLGDKHWSMDIKPAEKDGIKGIEITRHFTDRRTNKPEETIFFEAEHEENFATPVDPVTARALDLAKGCVERGEKEKALEFLTLLQKRLSPVTTKSEQVVAPNGP